MYKGKEVKVLLSEESNEVLGWLKSQVKEEIQKGVESSFHQTLLRSINRSIDLLKKDPFSGEQIKKRQIPLKYIRSYEVQNAWRMELSDRWRLIYTITGNKIEIVNFVMDIFNHKDYDKVFGYKH